MPKVLLLEVMPGGRTKRLQVVELVVVPRKGELYQLEHMDIIDRFIVEDVIHKQVLGSGDEATIALRLRRGESFRRSDDGPQVVQQPQLQRYDQPQALPSAVIDVTPEPPEEEWFFK